MCLEPQPHRHLRQTSWRRREALAERRPIDEAVGQIEVGAVQQVVDLGPQLESPPAAEVQRADDGRVDADEGRPGQDVPAGVAKRVGRARSRMRVPRTSPRRPCPAGTSFGRSYPNWPPRLPVLLLSVLTRGVNGRPVSAVKSALSCQPRAQTDPLDGSCQIAAATTRWRTSKSDDARSSSGMSAVLRRVVVAVAREKRRLVVDGMAPRPRAAQPEPAGLWTLDPHFERVVARRCQRLDPQHVAVAGNRPAGVDRTGTRRAAD